MISTPDKFDTVKICYYIDGKLIEEKIYPSQFILRLKKDNEICEKSRKRALEFIAKKKKNLSPEKERVSL